MLARFALALTVAAAATSVAPAGGQRFLLLVGVDRYDHSRFENLKFAERDVSALADVGRNAGYTVVLLTTAEGAKDPRRMPTRENIEAAFSEVMGRRNKADVVVVAFAGHGREFDRDPDCYFCPADAQPPAPVGKADPDREKKTIAAEAAAKASMVSLEDIYRRLDGCGAGAKVLLADCCRHDPTPGRGRGPDDVLDRVPPRGVLALFACSSGERAWEHSDLKHGVFFYHVLRCLTEELGNSDGAVEFDTLASYVRREVPKTVSRLFGEDTKQNPNLKAANVSGAPLVLLDRVDAKVRDDEAALRTGWWTREVTERFVSTYAPKRLTEWQAAADRGSVVGMFLVGRAAELGAGLTQDRAAAADWYRRAARRGYPPAMLFLGHCYDQGHGVPAGKADAVEWYRKSADLGEPVAMINLGLCYLEGFGVAADPREAARWYRKAADARFPKAMVMLGECHETGRGVPSDLAAAEKWYREAARLDDPDGMVSLGLLLYERLPRAQRRYKEGADWHRRAAATGHLEAVHLLAHCYGDGKGVEADKVKFRQLMTQAAEAGHVRAMRCVAVALQNGVGGEKDIAAAVGWFRKSSDRGDVGSQVNLGILYLSGEGVEQDVAAGFRLISVAAGEGSSFGRHHLAHCHLNGQGTPRNPAEGVRLMRLAADAGDSGAMTCLAHLYRNGAAGIPADRVAAVGWYRKAAAKDEPEAVTALREMGETWVED